jgi:beta-N-acetylhexosaminidase
VPSLHHAVGRLFFAGLPGPTLDPATRRLYADVGFGGVVLFRRNAGSPARMRKLTGALHALDRALPPLVAIDHEGGRVHRLDPPFTHFPPAAVVAAHGLASLREVARAMARELAAVGVDVTFGPVLDIASNPRNPIIGDRAFGSTAGSATSAARAWLRATRAEGLLTCGKHFPGHGDTATDSHLELPVVARGRRTLAARELAPFRGAIAARVPMLMTAHVRYPALDRRAPATLSAPILTRLLRGRLGFRGVICSDDLGMHAIADRYTVAEAAVGALAAGVDALLFCQDQEALREGAAAVERAVARGALPEARVREAYRRVVGLVRWRLRRPYRARPDIVGCRAHRELTIRLRG